MTKFHIALIAFVVSVTICCASPARLDKPRQLKSKFLARQELVEEIPTQTPYPPAGFRPEVPFNLPTDEKLMAPPNYYLPPVLEAANFISQPAEVYGPPALTYGPPEVSVKEEVDEIAEVEPVEQQEQPDEQKPKETQSNEDVPEEEQPEQEVQSEASEPEQEKGQASVEEGINDALLERVVLARSNGRKAAKLRSAKLQVLPAASQRRPSYLINGNVYTYSGQLFRL